MTTRRYIVSLIAVALLLLSFMFVALADFADHRKDQILQQNLRLVKIEAVRGQVLLDGQVVGSEHLEIAAGNRLVTGPDGEAVLLLANRSRVRLAPNTEVTILEIDGDKATLEVTSGRLLGFTEGMRLQIQSETASVSASKGEFVFSLDDDGPRLKVLSGNAKMKESVIASEQTVEAPKSVEDSRNSNRPTAASTQDSTEVGPAIASLDTLLTAPGLQPTHTSPRSKLGSKSKGKGLRTRISHTEEEQVGGLEEIAPDLDLLAPGPQEIAFVPTTPVAAAPIPTAVIPVAPMSAVGGLSGLAPALGALAGGLAVAGVVVAAAEGDSDSEVTLLQPVPSPSLP